jgi:hypothetical protein
MNSLFDLKQSAAELPSLNQGLAGMTYDQHPPTRDVTGSNFSNGSIYIRWQNSGGKWWIPSKSYIRMRAKLTQGDGITPVTMSDDIAPNMGLMANLFQSCEFKIADKTVSRVSDYVAQVDALTQRLTKSKSYLDSVGKSLNWWETSQYERMATISSDGCIIGDTAVSGISRLGQGFDAAAAANANNIEVVAATNHIVWTANGGQALQDLRGVYKPGDKIKYLLVEYTVIENGLPNGTLRDTAVQVRRDDGTAVANVAAASNVNWNLFKQSDEHYCPNRNQFEMIWKPPLSIFNISHAMPAGKYEIQLNPHNSTVFQKMAIETVGADRNSGLGNDFQFIVDDMYLYLAVVEGPVVDNISYFLSLEETRCQTENVDNNNSLQQRSLDVSPASFALTLAFQDTEAGTDTRRSASKFKVRKIFPANNVALEYPSGELALRRMYIQYGGDTKPSPDSDPDYIFDAVNHRDYFSSRYAETMLYSGSYFDCGGTEDTSQWLERGPYYYFSWPKSGSSESTRVNVNFQFQTPLGQGVGRVLLFDHYKQMVMVSVVNGMVVDVVSRDG